MAQAAKKIRGKTAPTFQFPKAFSTLEGIQAEFEEVGFSAEYLQIVESFLDLSNPKPFVDSFIRGKNPGAMFFVGDYLEAELDVFVDELLRMIEESHPELPRKLKGLMIVAVGKKSN